MNEAEIIEPQPVGPNKRSALHRSGAKRATLDRQSLTFSSPMAAARAANRTRYALRKAKIRVTS